MKKSRLVISLLVALPFTSLSQNSPEGLKQVAWLVGKWTVSAVEDDSDGSGYRETGFSQCEYVMQGRMIRCESHLITEEATGRYEGRNKSRSIINYFSYYQAKDQITLRYIYPSATYTQQLNQKSHEVFEADWVYANHPIGGDMDVKIRLEVLDKDRFQLTETLKSQKGSFSEHFKEVSRRIE